MGDQQRADGDPQQQQAQVQLAEANVARDDAALARAQELKARGFLSQASLDTALANQRSSAANLAAAMRSMGSPPPSAPIGASRTGCTG